MYAQKYKIKLQYTAFKTVHEIGLIVNIKNNCKQQ